MKVTNRTFAERSCVNYFSRWWDKIPNKNKLRKGLFGSQFERMVGHGSWYGGGAENSEVRKQREMNADVQFIFSYFPFYSVWDPRAWMAWPMVGGGCLLSSLKPPWASKDRPSCVSQVISKPIKLRRKKSHIVLLFSFLGGGLALWGLALTTGLAAMRGNDTKAPRSRASWSHQNSSPRRQRQENCEV